MIGAVPFRLRREGGAPQIEWVRTHGARFTDPFFEDTITRLAWEHPSSRRAARACTPLDRLREVPPAPPPTALIFHVSRCGSTLVSRMLAALPRNAVASEPPILDDILRLHRADAGVTEADQIAWLHGAVAALRQMQPGARRFFVKLDCWHLFALPLLQRAFPGVPRVFVFRHPLPVLVSLMRTPSLALVRGTLTAEELGLPDAERDGLPPEEHAAAVLGALFRAAARQREALVPVAYEELPDFVWAGMPGGDFTAEEHALLRETAGFDAKNPTRRFVADEAQKIAAASEALRAASARRAEPAYRAWLAQLERAPGRPTAA